MEESAFRKALTTLEFLSQDERVRQLYEDRQKALMTYQAEVEEARDEGREEGRQESRIAIARKMLAAGMDVGRIAEFVELPVQDVEAMGRDMNQQ